MASEPDIDNEDHRLPETLPHNCSVSVRGWETDNEDDAREFGMWVLEYVKAFSRQMDLSRLESVVIGMDYAEALASVDRGDGMPPAAPTANEYGEGGAMANHVFRNEEIWTVVVIWTPLVRQIMDRDHPHHGLALQTLCHELAHVDDMARFNKTYPGGWKAAKPRDGRDRVLQGIVNPCQSEYSAQRRAAAYAPEHGLDLLDMLGSAMREVNDQITAARRAYRIHGDMDVYWPIVERRLTFLFQSIGYGIGHADRVAEDAEKDPELAARYAEKLAELERLPAGWMLDACREAVQPFFLVEAWTGQEMYDPLIDVAERFLNENGMFTRPHGNDGVYVDMPWKSLRDL